jgi:hypothetical protein
MKQDLDIYRAIEVVSCIHNTVGGMNTYMGLYIPKSCDISILAHFYPVITVPWSETATRHKGVSPVSKRCFIVWFQALGP